MEEKEKYTCSEEKDERKLYEETETDDESMEGG